MPAFSENKNDVSEAAVPDRDDQDSKFLSRGKYFLLVILILGQAVGAYVLVDEHYTDIYLLVFGDPPDYSTTYLLEEIIVNPSGGNSPRFLVVEIGIKLSHHNHVELVDKNLMMIHDRLNEVIASRTSRELMQFEVREELRRELAHEVNQAIGVRSVRNLYFTKYVMQ